MDEFLAQFLIESRELVGEAVDDLLELEKNPGDRERFDDVFRAFHTLKGGAGIVEFKAMQEALHSAEDVLAAARAGASTVSPADIGNCLACLDQIVEWLDAIDSTGALPSDADAGALVARFGRSTAEERTAARASAADRSWIAKLLAAHGDAAQRARTAVRYRPTTESFFRHEDPLERVAALPRLLALDVEPRVPWPPLEELDPYSCNLTITALCACAPTEAVAALGGASAECEVEPAQAPPRAAATPKPAARADELLAAQLHVLAETGEEAPAARIASAGRVAANVLRHTGRHADAERIAAVTQEAAARAAPEELRRALAALLEGGPDAAAVASTERQSAHREQTLRVAAPRVDTLVRLTGELTVAKNAIGHAAKLAADQGSPLTSTLKQRHEALDRLVGEIQRSVLTLRVLPLRAAFQRFPRLVREMAAELHKPVTLVLEGEHTEADKTIVELIGEPLVHVVRNAMDHGIEDEATRAAAGKPAVATIRLRALREGDRVAIEVIDDGRGIDVARVRAIASERNVVAAEALESMSDPEVIDLIFEPGFSTARSVTALSGRGVGLDAVRTAVKRLGGQVAVSRSGPGGTTVRLTLPFSVMMTEIMTVEAGGQPFGIPLEAVVETLRIPVTDVFAVGSAHAIVLRGRTVPLVDLAQSLGTQAGPLGGDSTLVVIAEIDGDVGALQVDRVGERMAIMLQPPGGLLAGVPGIAGYTLRGDGSVLLLLDLEELLR